MSNVENHVVKTVLLRVGVPDKNGFVHTKKILKQLADSNPDTYFDEGRQALIGQAEFTPTYMDGKLMSIDLVSKSPFPSAKLEIVEGSPTHMGIGAKNEHKKPMKIHGAGYHEDEEGNIGLGPEVDSEIRLSIPSSNARIGTESPAHKLDVRGKDD